MTEAFGDLAGIVDAFGAAAIDHTRWDTAMEIAARSTRSFGALLFMLGSRAPVLPTSAGLRSTNETYVRDGWIHRDKRYLAAPKIMKTGVGCDLDFTTSEEIDRDPYYQEFLRPQGLRWFAGVKVGDGEDFWVMSLQRSIDEGPFSADELQRLGGLSRRLSASAELARAFGFGRIEGALQAFEMSRTAVAMMGRTGEVILLNESAERLMGRDLSIQNQRIVSFDQRATALLDAALRKIVWLDDADADRPAITLPRRGGRPILAYPSRLPGIAADGFPGCQVFVVFVDLAARRTTPEAELIHAFGLTKAEARLANGLANEEILESVADKLGITYQTARTVLKSVFLKTGTNRQVELISLLHRFPSRKEPS